MKQKGFTLIELLGVIVILSIILLIAVPSTLETLRRASEKEYRSFLTNLYTASETYVEVNRSLFPQLNNIGGKINIPVQTLIDENLIRKMGIDPETGVTIPTTYTVVATTQTDKTILYSLSSGNTNINAYVQSGLVMEYDGINNVGVGHNYTSTVWNDMTTSRKDGLLTNFNYDANSGWNDSALLFDGTNDYIALGSSGSFSTVTISAWIYKHTDGHWNGIIGGRFSSWIHLQTTVTGTLSAYVYGPNLPLGATEVVPNNQWTNITLNYTGAIARLYINNVQCVVTASGSGALGTSADLRIGNVHDDGRFFDGMISSVKIYNRSLTTNEMTQNYTLDRARFGY